MSPWEKSLGGSESGLAKEGSSDRVGGMNGVGVEDGLRSRGGSLGGSKGGLDKYGSRGINRVGLEGEQRLRGNSLSESEIGSAKE